MTSRVSTYESLSDFAPDWLTPPGESIQDLLEQRSWTQAELATRTGFTPKHISELIKGHTGLTEDAAFKLERVLGGSARFWLNLESQFREQIARNKDRETLSAAAAWLKELPLADMIRFGWIEKIADTPAQVQAALTYFNVASVAAWQEQYAKPVAAYRAHQKLLRTAPAVSTWLRQGEIQAAKLDCRSYDAERFRAALQQVRSLSQDPDPKSFLPKLQSLCALAGVAVALAPAPKGCPVSGASRWLSSHHALILLSLRGKTDDKFWFTFFHEAGHILKHGKRLVFLDIFREDGLDPKEEAEADDFARDWLIPQQDYQAFVKRHDFSESSIRRFAATQHIAPAIVLGRLQYEKRLHWNSALGKSLTVHFHWPHED